MPATPPSASAPGDLEFVRQFVNTLDIEAGTDRLADPVSYRLWAIEHGVDPVASDSDLAEARSLREAIREALIANHDRAPLPARSVDALNAASVLARSTVRFLPEGMSVASAAPGVGAVFGRIVTAVVVAMADSTWDRLKACAADECRWGFYDASRSRTGQWCSMSICGNRAKQASYRIANRTTRQVAPRQVNGGG